MKKRNILKRWYNSIDVLRLTSKNYEVKAENADEKAVKQKAFYAWRGKFLERNSFKNGLRDLKIKNFKNFMNRHFQPWLKLTEKRSSKKFKFIRKRGLKICRKAFDHLKVYVQAA